MDVSFEKVDPEEIPDLREASRGRVSYPICKGFLETGHPVAKLNRRGMNRSMVSLKAGLDYYIKKHELPIKLFSRAGELYMMRLDIDFDGKPIEDWKDKAFGNGDSKSLGEETPIEELSEEAIRQRLEEFKGQVTR